MLGDAVGLDNICFDHELTSVENKGESAVCSFTNGQSFEGDVIVDGINSNVRELLIGGVTFRPSEFYAYRFRSVIDLSDVDIDPAAQTGFTHATGGCLLYRSEKGRRIGLAQYRVRTPLKISSTFLGVGPRHLFRNFDKYTTRIARTEPTRC